MGQVGQEARGFVGSFGQIGHAAGRLAGLVVQPGLQGRADRLVEPLDGEQRIGLRGQVGRFGQFTLGDRHLPGEQVEAAPGGEHPAPAETLLRHGQGLGQAPDPVQVTAVERGLRGLRQPGAGELGVAGKLGRAFPGRRGLERRALAGGQGGSHVQRRGGRVIRPGRGRG